MTVIRLLSLLALAAVLSSHNTLGQSPAGLKRPISLDKTSGGDLFVLDASGEVLRLKISPQGAAPVSSFRLEAFT